MDTTKRPVIHVYLSGCDCRCLISEFQIKHIPQRTWQHWENHHNLIKANLKMLVYIHFKTRHKHEPKNSNRCRDFRHKGLTIHETNTPNFTWLSFTVTPETTMDYVPERTERSLARRLNWASRHTNFKELTTPPSRRVQIMYSWPDPLVLHGDWGLSPW